jgi:hypothetical protein
MKLILFLVLLVFKLTNTDFLNSVQAGVTKGSSMESIELASIEIQINEKKNVFEHLEISYLSFSHEHSSSEPGEPFAATTGVYTFEIKEVNLTSQVTFYAV